MKFLSILILNVAFISVVHAAEQVTNEAQQQTSSSAISTLKSDSKNPAPTAASAENPEQQQSEQQYSVLKTQFLGKRPYMEKSAR